MSEKRKKGFTVTYIPKTNLLSKTAIFKRFAA
jgi:hypothetical protein